MQVLAIQKGRAISEVNVVLGEALFCQGWRGNENYRAGTKSKKDDRAIFSRDVFKSSMDGLFEKMKMADDWNGWRAWWEIFALFPRR